MLVGRSSFLHPRICRASRAFQPFQLLSYLGYLLLFFASPAAPSAVYIYTCYLRPLDWFLSSDLTVRIPFHVLVTLTSSILRG